MLFSCLVALRPFFRDLSRSRCSQAIKNAKNALGATRYGPDTLSIELAQVGNGPCLSVFSRPPRPLLNFCERSTDQKAVAFLNEIDRHPDIGRFVDVTSNFENESAQMQQTTGCAPFLRHFALCEPH